ncbi:ATP-binding cassette domain-containing protein [Alteromonas sp. 1_MG-2023]|uniref:ATP-binding cassette domain-containing protein n=1 Tax=Alteromonas sp. 1_MG-2023 TaxID=3062669 RepID=UPI0026E2CEF6|nr:ATP-binding cassette domain-containing protein [Alteromonas sp. 1_MG-2023]MDO6568085.1 ATP-binding cassette domain-containing protein [Alteromonas sp. 1_MG-2023]
MTTLSLHNYQVKLDNNFITPEFSFTVYKGEHVLIAGRNRAGKSLLMTALAGRGKALAGTRNTTISVAEVSVAVQQALILEEKQKDSADLLDIVPEPTLVHELLSQTNPNFIQHSAYEALSTSLNVEHLLNTAFLSLSTGETRKVLLLLAWVSNADVILIDEPFEGLDKEARARFNTFLSQQTQSTLVITANTVRDVPKVACKLVLVDALQIVSSSDASMAPEALVTRLSSWFSLSTAAPTLPPSTETSKIFPKDEPLIALRDGCVKYDDNTVFKELDFMVYPGQHWQISGPNGSGKTCLLTMITGDNPHCYTNDLTLFGIKRGTGESIWDIKQHIGIMSNALHMQYRVNCSAHHVVTSGFYDSIGLYTTPTNAENAIADAWLDVIGFSDNKHTPFNNFSFGEQRLLLIVRAMVKHPAVLILDEPCNGLDDINRTNVLALIKLLAGSTHTTLLYVTHIADEAIEGIDNLLDMRDYQG